MLSCISMIEARAREAKITVNEEIPEDLPALRADVLHIKQIVLNLLSNAVKFTPSGGHTKVCARLNDNAGLEITVTDTGLGISAVNVPKVLQPFGQVAESHNRGHAGTGLGLPICSSLMKLHNGNLTIHSEIDKGTSVTVSFPPERTILRN